MRYGALSRTNIGRLSIFVDAQGRTRHHHFGEGAYEQSERFIQKLLAEAGAGGIGQELVSVDAVGVEAAADWGSLRSPENYLGYERTERFASPGGAVSDKSRVYAATARLSLNHWALSGDWTMKKGAAVLNKPGGRIAYRFHARDLHLVMGPAARGTSVRFRVLIDGQPPGAAHGIDVDEEGIGTVSEQRLYQLIRQSKPIADRLFEIEFLDSGRRGICVHVRLIWMHQAFAEAVVEMLPDCHRPPSLRPTQRGTAGVVARCASEPAHILRCLRGSP